MTGSRTGDGEAIRGPDPGGVDAGLDQPSLIAYATNPRLRLPIVPAASRRTWMDATLDSSANRCLPLLIGNQSGWFLLTTHRLRLTWNGGPDRTDTLIECLEGGPPFPVISHFGSGIVSWIVPYLFRSPPGYNLLVRAPANWPKHGAHGLDAVVETDWAMAPFTMNWKLTAPGLPVVFERDEPICMLVPQRRGELESFHPEIRDISTEPRIADGVERWARSRAEAVARVERLLAERSPDHPAPRLPWQKHYLRGTAVGGGDAPGHQLRLRLREFTVSDGGGGQGAVFVEGMWGHRPPGVVELGDPDPRGRPLSEPPA